MARYSYLAKSQPKDTLRGIIEAESEQEAIDKITKMGYFPISLRAEDISSGRQSLWRLKRNSRNLLAAFSRQLSTLIEAGVNIIESLNIISAQLPNQYFKAALSDIASNIRNGKTLSESFSFYPYLFSNLYISIIHSGEVGGNLSQSLKSLSTFLEKEEEFKSSVRTALIYPVFIIAVGILTVVSLLGFVIPKLATMFEDLGQALPLPTRIIIAISTLLSSYWWLIAFISALFVFLLHRLYRSQQGRILWDSLKLRLIIFGDISLKGELSRLMRTLSLLLSSGIAIIQALDISSSVVENKVLSIELEKVKEQIRNGLSFSRSLKGLKLLPEFMLNIIIVGEESGTLEKSLLGIAEDYEKDVERALKTLTRMLEPVIILVMGLVVGFIVLSMLLPIFQLNLIVR